MLVVEDDLDMALLISDTLTREGFRVTIQTRGDAALEAVAQPFDAFIVDKQMPGADGFDVVSEIRRRFRSIPVIFITAFGGRLTARAALHRGASRYLEKPMKLADLVDTLRAALIEARTNDLV